MNSIFQYVLLCLFLSLPSSATILNTDSPSVLSLYLTSKRATEINIKASGIWKATHANGFLKGATLPEIMRLLGTKLTKPRGMNKKTYPVGLSGGKLPKSFDAAKQWPDCKSISEISDQAGCGSCWAVAAATAMTDRYCISTGNKNLRLSAGNLLSCCPLCGFGCNGGIPYMAWMYWVWSGLPSTECYPYPFESCSHHSPSSNKPPCNLEETPDCQETCKDGSLIDTLYYGKTTYSLEGELDFMYELYKNGPFEVGFTVYDDFLYYKDGIYVVTEKAQPLGGHAVRLIGWGEENGVKYWKVANSWNEEWGNNGYFLIRRGTNECGFEDNGVAGLAPYHE